ncbi:MAG: lipid-A-disaccharide synthase [Bacteroidetes bacterium RIFCSPLOWO2_12_FULL_35_15]|nr:MAG: lipid-A-disaccharide synthase [Bacteroidetes bacterium RIFCSPLOWO2_12_FULL_35_15]
MNYYIIAGEASGDLHASNLMKELKNSDAKAQFRCWGGDLMKEQGATIVKHYRDLAFMGFTEVLMNLRTIFKNIDLCKKDISQNKPDVLILVDYPGFNLRIAEYAKTTGIKTFYYISPQVWAWKESRVHKIKRIVDKMFVILPFEKEFYQRYNYQVDFVGHPLLDAVQQFSLQDNSLSLNSSKPIVALLPGSRKQEIATILPLMLSMQKHYPDFQFVIAGAPSQHKEFYQTFIRNADVKIVFNQTYQLLQKAEAALVTSGTATLEAALFGVPEVVCYKGGAISYCIAKKLVKVKYISLVNLIMDKEIVKELIQNELNETNLKIELDKLFNSNSRKNMLNNYAELKTKLGGPGASKKTAGLMFSYLK